MQEITLYNYEAFMLDFYDGNLDVVQTEQLMDFLELHPELKAEFESFDSLTLTSDEFAFPDQELLLIDNEAFKSKITTDNCDAYSIAFYEGLLTDDKKEELLLFLSSNPSFNLIHNTYAKTYLPQETIVFESKKSLIHQEPKIIYAFFKYSAIAAGLILGVFLINKPEKVYYYEAIEAIAEIELQDNFDTSFDKRIAVVNASTNSSTNSIEKPAGISTDLIQPKIQTIDQNKINMDKTVLANISEDTKKEKPIEVIDQIEIKEVSVDVNQTDLAIQNVRNAEMPIQSKFQEYASVGGAAMNVIRKDLLKNKPVIEALAEEITAVTNEKVKVMAKKGLTKKVQEFALEIGSFSISKKY